MKIKFNETEYILKPFPYTSGRFGIMLVDSNEESNKLAATLDIPGVSIRKDEVIIKNHDLNKGLLDVLISEKIIDKQFKDITLGFNKVYLCKLLIKEWIKKT